MKPLLLKLKFASETVAAFLEGVIKITFWGGLYLIMLGGFVLVCLAVIIWAWRILHTLI